MKPTAPPNPPKNLHLAGQGYAATTDAADDAPAVPPQVPAGEGWDVLIDIEYAEWLRPSIKDLVRRAVEAGRKAGRIEGLEEAAVAAGAYRPVYLSEAATVVVQHAARAIQAAIRALKEKA